MKVAILIDGAFLRARHRQIHNGRYPSVDYVESLCLDRIMNSPLLKGDYLFRVYYYDCRPFAGTLHNPISGESTDYTAAPTFLDNLAHRNFFQVRAGELKFSGWRLSDDSLRRIIDEGRIIKSDDLQPTFQQKQVDINIGLDIAWLSQQGIVDKIVLITSDSDFIPAMDFARQSGAQVYLVHLDVPLKESLLENADAVIRIDPCNGAYHCTLNNGDAR